MAVDGVDLDLFPGEIHALVGENGAGKSTLAAIAFGALTPDAGSITAEGSVGLVHQHFELVGRLSVWQNIVLGREPKKGPFIDKAAAIARARQLAAQNALELDPLAIVEVLPVGVQQRVELLKELNREPRVLLLDEPTATLAPAEIDAFFVTIEKLARAGTAVLIVTHKLKEVIAHTQLVTVMRAGKMVAHFATAQTSVEAIARAMVGGELPLIAAREATTVYPTLRVERVAASEGGRALRGVSLEVGRGEIVGIAGVEGNGQTLLADAIAGVIPYDGTISLEGTLLPPADPTAHLRAGIRAIAQDRQHEAMIAGWSLAENVVLGDQRTSVYARGITLDLSAARLRAREIIQRFDVRTPSETTTMGNLSGGNQQKVIVGRALLGDPKVVVAYQPTRGIDIGAAALVHSRLIEARNSGVAVLLISFELDELLALADRIIVMYGGEAVGHFERAAFDRERIGELMAGLRRA